MTVPPPSSSLSPSVGEGGNSNTSQDMQLQGGTSSGLTSPNGGTSTPGVAPDLGAASTGTGGGSAGSGAGSAAVSPAIAVSPPTSCVPSSGMSAAGLNFSASSLAGSAVVSSVSSGLTGTSMPDAMSGSGQLLADCDPARLAALSYPRLGAGGLGSMYTAAAAASYPSTDQNPYPSIAMENSFYGPLVSLQLSVHLFNTNNEHIAIEPRQTNNGGPIKLIATQIQIRSGDNSVERKASVESSQSFSNVDTQ